jgi:hypothetical protein
MCEDEATARASLQAIIDIPEKLKGTLDKMVTNKAVAVLRRKTQKILALEMLFAVGYMGVLNVS